MRAKRITCACQNTLDWITGFHIREHPTSPKVHYTEGLGLGLGLGIGLRLGVRVRVGG